MDLSKFKTSDWMKVGGALAFFIFGFFDWVTVDAPGGIASISVGNVFDFTFTGLLPWLLIMLTGVISALLVLDIMKPGKLPWPLIFLAASAFAAFLLLIRLIFNPVENSDLYEAAGASVGRSFGMIVCVIAGLVVFAGAFLGFKESGGDFNDLKDIEKLKSQFGVSSSAAAAGDTPPPPPPAGVTPPPPPPAPGTPPPPPPPAP
jgi:hypothetical protein